MWFGRKDKIEAAEKAKKTAEAERRAKILELAIATRNFEIQQLGTRNSFAYLAQAGLLAVMFKNGQVDAHPETLMLTGAGLVLSVIQIQMAAGAKFWQERWELLVGQAERSYLEQLKTIDSSITGIEMFCGEQQEVKRLVINNLDDHSRARSGPAPYLLARYENTLIAMKFSPSRAPIRMATALFLLWLVLTGHVAHALYGSQLAGLCSAAHSVESVKGQHQAIQQGKL